MSSSSDSVFAELASKLASAFQLGRPIAFFDLETTGVKTSEDRIVEISVLRIDPGGSFELKTRRLNPGMPIPAAASAIHGITDADVADEQGFEQIARSLAEFMHGCDLAGFNVTGFDLPMLIAEFERADVDFDQAGRHLIDMQVIFHQKEQRHLGAAYKFYCGKELEGAHGAETDTRASVEVLLGQLDLYSDLPRDVEGLEAFFRDPQSVDLRGKLVWDDEGEAVFNFGKKHMGDRLRDVASNDPSYLQWMLDGSFPQDTKEIVRAALGGELPTRYGSADSPQSVPPPPHEQAASQPVEQCPNCGGILIMDGVCMDCHCPTG